MDENKPKNQSSDEIDLSQVFKWIGKGFQNFGNSILNGLAGLRSTFFKNKIFFGLVIAAGLTIGSIYSEILSKKFYKSSMILSCDYLNSRIVTNSFDKLNLLCGEKEREGLADELKIDKATAKNILHFTSKPFVAEKELIEIEVLKEQLNNVAESKKDLVSKIISKIDIENKHAFLIEVTVLNPDIIKNLEKSLVDYFGDNNYIKNRVETHKTYLLGRKAKLIQESKKLDSLKSVLYDNLQIMAKQNHAGGSNNVILSDKSLTNPLEVYAEDLSINNQLLSIDQQLTIRQDFEVIDSFTTFKEPDSASLPKVLVISFMVSWVLAYLILGFFKFDRYLSKLSKETN